MKKNILSLAILAVIALPALAEDTDKRYFGLGYGSVSLGNASQSSNPNVFRYVSGYHFTPMLAVEIDYSMFGNFTVGNGVDAANVSAASLQIASVGFLPLGHDFDLIGKIGLASNIANGSTTIPGHSGAYLRHSDVFIGVGAQYYVSSKFSLLAMYDNYGKFENSASPLKASSLTLGLVYHY